MVGRNAVRGKEADAARPQDAPDLGDRPVWVIHMIQPTGADADGEARILERLVLGRPHHVAPRARYENADEFREALSAGAAGHTFDDDPTAKTSVYAGDDTSATRV